MTLPCIRLTAYELVAHELGPSRMTAGAVQTALKGFRRRGYLPNWVPTPEAYHQEIVLVPASHSIAALYRAVAPDGNVTPVPRGLVESRTRSPITSIIAGMILSRFGLAIMQVKGCCVSLRSTSMELANDANCGRCIHLPPVPTRKLIERATGVRKPSTEIDDDLRLRAALVYDAHALMVQGLLEGADRCTRVSHWQFPAARRQSDELTPPF